MILFRPEVSKDVGVGHLMRCTAIAEELRKRKVRCGFLLKQQVCNGRIPLKCEPVFSYRSGDHGPREARETISLVHKLRPKLIVVDSYEQTSHYYEHLRSEVPAVPIVACDDSGTQRPTPVYGYLGFGLAADPSVYPQELINRSVIGPRFIPIRKEFHSSLRQTRIRAQVKRLLVTMGGSDPENQTIRLVRILRGISSDVDRIDVVLGPLYGDGRLIREIVAGDKRFRIHTAPRNLARLMSHSDLAITGGGSTCAELGYLGVPMIVLILSENQRPVARLIAARRCGHVLGDFAALSDGQIREAIEAVIQNNACRQEYARNAQRLVDGKGSERIADFLVGLVSTYHRDRYTTAEIRRKYDRSSRMPNEFSKVRWGSLDGMINRFRIADETINWELVSRWLDVGCGTGAFLREIEKSRGISSYVGLDISPRLLKFARRQSYRTMNRRFVAGDFSKRSADGDYDLITCLGVLQNCGVPLVKAVALLAEALSPGGQLFVTTKNRDWAAFQNPKIKPEPRHHWFSVSEIKEAFALAGLSISKLSGFEPRTGGIISPEYSHSIFIYASKTKRP